MKSWTLASSQAFQQLKQALVQTPVLILADFTLPFSLYSNASSHGLGAVLAQMQEGVECVMAYASRSLCQTKKNDLNYSSFKVEFLALKWEVTEKFHDYLLGASFTVHTDNNPLAHFQTANLGRVEQRGTISPSSSVLVNQMSMLILFLGCQWNALRGNWMRIKE